MHTDNDRLWHMEVAARRHKVVRLDNEDETETTR